MTDAATGAATALVVSTSAYLGFQATIRFVVYPQFARVPAAAFAAYERAHQRAVAPLVGVVFVAELVSGVLAVIGGRTAPGLLALAGVVVVVGLTGLFAVPRHRRLSGGFDDRAHRRLLVVDTARLGAAAVSCGAAVWAVVC